LGGGERRSKVLNLLAAGEFRLVSRGKAHTQRSGKPDKSNYQQSTITPYQQLPMSYYSSSGCGRHNAKVNVRKNHDEAAVNTKVVANVDYRLKNVR